MLFFLKHQYTDCREAKARSWQNGGGDKVCLSWHNYYLVILNFVDFSTLLLHVETLLSVINLN